MTAPDLPCTQCTPVQLSWATPLDLGLGQPSAGTTATTSAPGAPPRAARKSAQYVPHMAPAVRAAHGALAKADALLAKAGSRAASRDVASRDAAGPARVWEGVAWQARLQPPPISPRFSQTARVSWLRPLGAACGTGASQAAGSQRPGPARGGQRRGAAGAAGAAPLGTPIYCAQPSRADCLLTSTVDLD